MVILIILNGIALRLGWMKVVNSEAVAVCFYPFVIHISLCFIDFLVESSAFIRSHCL